MGSGRAGKAKALAWVGALAGLGLLVSACSSSVGDPQVPTSPPAPDPADAAMSSPARVASVSPSSRSSPSASSAEHAALDFTGRRLSGGSFEGIDLQGREVVLWMWAPWCPQCNREAPHVAEAVERFGDRVTFVGVPGHDTDAAHRAFVDEHDLDDIVHVVDDDGSLWARFGINYQPAWVFVDADGDARVVAGGLYDELGEHVRDLVDG